MSDFDKEAEREKLRKKYERDKAERQATQRMSDLLLKGATMTNSHCGTCGDPLFEQDGTTFCPSCHGNPDAVEGTSLEAQPAEESGDENAAGEDEAPVHETPTPADRDGTTGDESAADTAGDDRAEPSAQTEPSRAGERGKQATASEPTADEQPADRTARTHNDASRRSQSRSTAPTPSRRSGASSDSPAGDLEAAHGSLVAALEKFAAQAVETDDPRYAKECLEAAREASETLDVLR